MWISYDMPTHTHNTLTNTQTLNTTYVQNKKQADFEDMPGMSKSDLKQKFSVGGTKGRSVVRVFLSR
jgi:hypothetical protein